MRISRTTLSTVAWLMAAAVAATLLAAALGLDLALSARYYDPVGGWPLTENEPWRFLYRYGDKLVWAVPAAALAILAASLVGEAARKHRRTALYLLLVALIGPGLIVNWGFKANWGRSRPRNVVEFGGKSPFTQPWEPRSDPKGNSFPSGHASWAFYLVSPYFVLRRKKPRAAKAFLYGGAGYGVLMGAARIVQGAHFATDVVWAGALVCSTSAILADLVLEEPPPEER